jgi:hypothetical protein
VLLEPGRGLIRGMSKLKIFLWNPCSTEPVDIGTAGDACQSIMEESSAASVTESGPFGGSVAKPRDDQAAHEMLVYESLQKFERLRAHKASNCLQKIGCIHAMDTACLQEVQECVSRLLTEFVQLVKYAGPDSPPDNENKMQIDGQSMMISQRRDDRALFSNEISVEDMSLRMREFVSRQSSEVPADGFLMRELRADLLPGRIFWSCDTIGTQGKRLG